MKIIKTCSILLYLSLICSPSFAEIPPFQSNENTGLNKKERIDELEKYLSDLAGTLKKMETKLDENTKKVQSLNDVVKLLKDAQDKKVESDFGEKKITDSKEAFEIEKLKLDILILKNQDIEKLKNDVKDLNDTLRFIRDKK